MLNWSDLPAVDYGGFGSGGSWVSAQFVQFVQDVQSLYYVSEDCMLAIEPGTGHECYEELRAVGVGAGIGHRQQTWS